VATRANRATHASYKPSKLNTGVSASLAANRIRAFLDRPLEKKDGWLTPART
jgi:hypothetical protein